MSINILVSDELGVVFANIDWYDVRQKDLCLVCHQWQTVLESTDHGYDFDFPGSLSLTTTNKFADRVNWRRLSRSCRLDDQFIRQYAHRLNWYSMLTQQSLSVDIVCEFYEKIDWKVLSSSRHLTEDVVHIFSCELCEDRIKNSKFLEILNSERVWYWNNMSVLDELRRRWNTYDQQ